MSGASGLRHLWVGLALDDNDDDVMDEPQDPAPAAPVAAVPAPGRRGRRAGFSHGRGTISKIKMGRKAAELRRQKADFVQLSKAVATTAQELISRDAFGLHVQLKPQQRGSQKTVLASGDGAFSYSLEVKRTTGRAVDIGVCSHMKAVPIRLKRFIAGSGSVIVGAILDDARLWVRQPKEMWTKHKVIDSRGKERKVTRGRINM